MKPEIFDLFPLSVFKDKVLLSDKEKKELLDHIFAMEKKTENIKKSKHDAWLGDTKGQEFFLKNPKMKKLSLLIGEKIKNYTEMLSIDNEKIIFFFQ